MYLRLNGFNYQELLNVIIRDKGLEDHDIPFQKLCDTLEEMSKKMNRDFRKASNQLDPVDKLIFLAVEEQTKQYSIDGSFDEVMAMISDRIINIITSSYDPNNDLVDEFHRRVWDTASELYPTVVVDERLVLTLEVEDFLPLLNEICYAVEREVVEARNEYVETQFQNAIMEQLKFGESPIRLTVIRQPGNIVKYGDHLITFPILLLEVFGNDY